MGLRTPTPAAQLLAWYWSALKGEQPPIHDADPQVGWFKVRLVARGPFVPAKIWVHRDIDPLTGELTDDERYLCEIDGERRDPFREWVWLAKNPIPRAEYEELCDLRAKVEDMAATRIPFDLTRNVVRP